MRPLICGGLFVKHVTIPEADSSSAISRNAWFFPFKTKTFVTRPNGIPNWIISASLDSLGMFRRWITFDVLPGKKMARKTLNKNHLHMILFHRRLTQNKGYNNNVFTEQFSDSVQIHVHIGKVFRQKHMKNSYGDVFYSERKYNAEPAHICKC